MGPAARVTEAGSTGVCAAPEPQLPGLLWGSLQELPLPPLTITVSIHASVTAERRRILWGQVGSGPDSVGLRGPKILHF